MGSELMAQSTNYGVSHSNLIFTSGIAEKLGANITAPIGNVASFGAGSFFCLMGSQRVGLHGDGCVSDFLSSGIIAELLAAAVAAPIVDNAFLGTSGRLASMCSEFMAQCRNLLSSSLVAAGAFLMLASLLRAGGCFIRHSCEAVAGFSVFRATTILTFVPVRGFIVGPFGAELVIYHRSRDIGNFGLAVRVTEQFPAAVAAPIGDVALSSAGGCFGIMGGELVTQGRDYSIIQSDFHSTGRVTVKLAAAVAAPVGNVAFGSAGGSLGVMGGELMTKG